MPLVNLGTQHFDDTEKQQIRTAVEGLKTLIMARTAKLTPEERKQYGSVNEINKLVINKVKSFADTKPGMASPDVNWAEFKKDYDSREFLEEIEEALQELVVGISNTRILHDWDNFHAALTDYGYTQYKDATSTPGFETKYNELKQFFIRSKTVPETNGEAKP